jgi:hypothetical protein
MADLAKNVRVFLLVLFLIVGLASTAGVVHHRREHQDIYPNVPESIRCGKLWTTITTLERIYSTSLHPEMKPEEAEILRRLEQERLRDLKNLFYVRCNRA